MPAVTVDDLLTLPRVTPASWDAATARPERSVTTAPRGFEGEGFPVPRAFACDVLTDLNPYIHLDQMGEVEYAPGEPKGTPWHPHRGFETVTYMLDGALRHQDSNGRGGLITDGETQGMTAGSGMLHIEAPPEDVVVKGGLFHGFQLWVNLPRAMKWNAPRYQDLRGSDVALATSHDGGALLRIIAGEVAGVAGPGSTYTPITLIHATLEPGAELRLPWKPGFNRLAYALAGRGSAGRERRALGTGQLAVFGAGDEVVLTAAEHQESRAPKLDVLLLGGQPIREQVAWYGPFVMNTKAEVIQAFVVFQAGKLGTIPALHDHGNVDVTDR